jgi:hypothetical protein
VWAVLVCAAGVGVAAVAEAVGDAVELWAVPEVRSEGVEVAVAGVGPRGQVAVVAVLAVVA